MSEYDSLQEGLTSLIEKMKEQPITWNESLQNLYYSRQDASESLRLLIANTAHEHNAWANMFNPMSMMEPSFGSECWLLSYQQLSKHYGVPMSWFHAISIRAITDPMHKTWRVGDAVELIDDEGYLLETAYAAYLDGVSDGLLEETDGIAEMRHPKMIEVSNMILQGIEEQAQFHDMTIEEAVKALSQSHDMTPA